MPVVLASGSSPLVRGQRRPADGRRRHERIIPARAGPTESPSKHQMALSDHPRSCGANMGGNPEAEAQFGSSPLVRGQRRRTRCHRLRRRIIPARAGPTPVVRVRGWFQPDHPRSCGANGVRGSPRPASGGSSPLVRGQRRRPHIGPIPGRIIPARAGPTASWIVSNLPPRIIPARAGPTQWRAPVKSYLTDHPRSCGANLGVTRIHASGGGSSPLVRGQQTRFNTNGTAIRIIPARAGPTSGIGGVA